MKKNWGSVEHLPTYHLPVGVLVPREPHLLIEPGFGLALCRLGAIMKKFAVYLGYMVMLACAWIFLREGIALTYGLTIPKVGDPDGWKPMVGSVMVLTSLWLYDACFKYINKE